MWCSISKGLCTGRVITGMLDCAHAGIGAVGHHMGQALSLAIQLNRTMVLAPGPFNVVTFTATHRYLQRVSMAFACQCCRQ